MKFHPFFIVSITMRVIASLFFILFFTSCSTIPGLKMPELWKSMGNTADKALQAGKAASDALDQITLSDKKLQEARLKIEQEYEVFRKDLTAAYKKREEVDFANFDEISKVNYGIYYVTDNDKKYTDIDFLIAHSRAKENIARLDQLPEETRLNIRAEVDQDRTKAMSEVVKKYEQKVREGLLAAMAYEEATQIIAQKEEEKRKLREENTQTLARLEAQKQAEVERIKKETELKIQSAKEEQRMEMLRWIVKALGIVGILQLVGGLLLKSPTFIIAGIFTIGMAYIAVMVPFWIVAVSMGVIILAMVIVNPKTGKCDIFKNKDSKISPRRIKPRKPLR
jgi:hypothetical protein